MVGELLRDLDVVGSNQVELEVARRLSARARIYLTSRPAARERRHEAELAGLERATRERDRAAIACHVRQLHAYDRRHPILNDWGDSPSLTAMSPHRAGDRYPIITIANGCGAMSDFAEAGHPHAGDGEAAFESHAATLAVLTRTGVRVLGVRGALTERFAAALSVVPGLGPVTLVVHRDHGGDFVGTVSFHGVDYRLHAFEGGYQIVDDTVMGSSASGGRLGQLDADLGQHLRTARVKGICRIAEAHAAAAVRDEFGPVNSLPVLASRSTDHLGLTKISVGTAAGRVDVRSFDGSSELFASLEDGGASFRQPTPEQRASWLRAALAAVDRFDAGRAEQVLRRFVEVARAEADVVNARDEARRAH